MFKEKIYCGLDIGSQRMKACVVKIKDLKNVQLIAIHETKTYGFQGTSITDLNELSECIHSTIQVLAKNAGLKLKGLQVGINGLLVNTRQTNTVIPLVDRGNKIISQRDLKNINHQARLLGVKMDEKILHDLPQCYCVDDTNLAFDPQGLFGRKLGVHSLMIMANQNTMHNIVKAVHQAGYDVANLFFGSYACSQVCLEDQDRQEGCIFVDVGASVTSCLVFKDRALKLFHKIDFGGEHLTQSIANHINLPFNLSEEIKKSHATALLADQHREEEILIKRENSYIPIKRDTIYQSLQWQINRLTEGLEGIIQNTGLYDRINRGIIMVGGCSLLSGLLERIGYATHMPVNLGKVRISCHKEGTNLSLFSSPIGLAMTGFQKTLGYPLSTNGQGAWTKQIASRMRELYQEYF